MRRRLIPAPSTNRALGLALALCIPAGCSSDDGSGSAGDGGVDATIDATDAAQDTAGDTATDPAPDTDAAPDADVDAPLEVSMTVVPDPGNPLSAYVELDTPVDTTGTVALDCGDGEWTVDVAIEDAATFHSVYLQGAWPGASCAISATVSDGDRDADATYDWDVTETLDGLPELTVTTPNPDAMQPGWTLVDITGIPDDLPLRFAVLDEQGRYRWVHRRAGSTANVSANDARILDEGILLGGSGWLGLKPAIITWDGRILWEGEVNQHHDIRPWPDANTFIYLGVDPDCEDEPSHTIEIVDRASNEITWTWRHCMHFEPQPPYRDWSHLNTVEPVPGENAVIISSRHQNSLFKVNVETDEIEWLLGHPPRAYEPEDIPVIALPDEDQIWRQHAPEIQPNGNILIFDNGDGREDGRPFSCLVELAIDESTLEAEVVWEWEHPDEIYAPQWGDADRLPNGNTLGTFGRKDIDLDSRFVEVTPDGDIVQEVVTPPERGIYRADRFDVEQFPRGYVLVDE